MKRPFNLFYTMYTCIVFKYILAILVAAQLTGWFRHLSTKIRVFQQQQNGEADTDGTLYLMLRNKQSFKKGLSVLHKDC